MLIGVPSAVDTLCPDKITGGLSITFIATIPGVVPTELATV